MCIKKQCRAVEGKVFNMGRVISTEKKQVKADNF